ncbi:hypothetical protein HPP92_003814 [Vanilla planifolia]|uniref:Uncharacterized protein n=1 Tax=Vanilla planifolia TaxID=51239 RepID=A0A835RYB5_VANPL|nr:hypothetical protein HPP92_003814 [Vanilla planifolia]
MKFCHDRGEQEIDEAESRHVRVRKMKEEEQGLRIVPETGKGNGWMRWERRTVADIGGSPLIGQRSRNLHRRENGRSDSWHFNCIYLE